MGGKIGGHHSLMPRSAIARGIAKFSILLFVLLAGFVTFFYIAPVYSLATWAPQQPIPYSHKLHAGDLEVNCQFCHVYARRSEMAGVPSLSKCMSCHSNLSIESSALTTLEEHFEQDKPIEWVRIYDLPDHVWFSHKRHVMKNIACQKCHGPVETLVVSAQLVTHHMGFCLDCHQEHEAPTDCWTCHI